MEKGIYHTNAKEKKAGRTILIAKHLGQNHFWG